MLYNLKNLEVKEIFYKCFGMNGLNENSRKRETLQDGNVLETLI